MVDDIGASSRIETVSQNQPQGGEDRPSRRNPKQQTQEKPTPTTPIIESDEKEEVHQLDELA